MDNELKRFEKSFRLHAGRTWFYVSSVEDIPITVHNKATGAIGKLRNKVKENPDKYRTLFMDLLDDDDPKIKYNAAVICLGPPLSMDDKAISVLNEVAKFDNTSLSTALHISMLIQSYKLFKAFTPYRLYAEKNDLVFKDVLTGFVAWKREDVFKVLDCCAQINDAVITITMLDDKMKILNEPKKDFWAFKQRSSLVYKSLEKEEFDAIAKESIDKARQYLEWYFSSLSDCGEDPYNGYVILSFLSELKVKMRDIESNPRLKRMPEEVRKEKIKQYEAMKLEMEKETDAKSADF